MEKICIILGAGASFDLHNGAVPVKNSELRPPLAKELFAPRFWQWRRNYTGAEVLGAELGRLGILEGAPFDLEETLSRYQSSKDQRVRAHFKHIPPYIRDVLISVCQEYVDSPTNHLNLVRRVLESDQMEAAFVSLNYDTFLEDALQRFDSTLTFGAIESYVQVHRQAKVFKIHGSINWAVPMPTATDWDGALRQFDPASPDLETVVATESQKTRVWRYKNKDRFLFPKLTAPVKEKTFTCPEEHTRALAAFLQSCYRYLVIGTSGLDEDLLNFLAKFAPTNIVWSQFVDMGDQGGITAERFAKHSHVFGSSSFRKTFNRGYTAYLDSKALEELLRTPI